MDLISRWEAEPAEHGLISDRDPSDGVIESKMVADCESQAEEGLGMAVDRLKHEEKPMEPSPPQPLPFELAMDLIFRWQAEPAEHGFISDSDPPEIHRYLQAVVGVVESKMVTDCQNQAEEAMGMAVARLKHEFLHILKRVTAAQDKDVNTSGPYILKRVTAAQDKDVNMSGPSYTSSFSETLSSTSMTTGSGVEYDPGTSALILEAVHDLQSIAQRMNSAGHLADFIDIYTGVRKSFLATHLKRVGIRKLSTSDTRVSDEFNMHIDRCIQACKVLYKILFPKEYKLSTQIFDRTFGDVCFSNTVKDAKIELMNFAEALINTRRAQEKLFRFLKLYNQLADLPAPLTREAEPIPGLAFQLVVVVRETLLNFEDAVIHEVLPVHKEATTRIHPSTRYVMDYITQMVDYEDILSKLIVSNPPTCFGDLMIPDVKFAEHEGQKPLALHLVLIVVVLRFKLEARSKIYKDDASLRHLFMTNNLDYIVGKIKSSPVLEAMIGEDYTKYLSENYLKQARASYVNSTCERMLHCLRDDKKQRLGNLLFTGLPVVRNRIKKFNILFEGFRSTQFKWEVEDERLRQELRLSIAERLVPAYKSFIERNRNRLGIGYSKKKYVKYSPEELGCSIVRNREY